MFCNRMEDLPLYHIFKLIKLLFGFIMMFDTSMFLLSFDTDWAQTTLVENTRLNAVYMNDIYPDIGDQQGRIQDM